MCKYYTKNGDPPVHGRRNCGILRAYQSPENRKEYNAGQIDIKIGKNGQAELVKVNNHVWKKSLNTTILSPERILEVKGLFVNALSAGGFMKV